MTKFNLYLHIPFCRQACHYCNFHFATSLHYKDDMLKALAAEMELQKKFTGEEGVAETIYLGGGTPSLLDGGEIESLIAKARSIFSVDKNAEITLECNPDDITGQKLQEWKQAGINRLSIGIQSFRNSDLEWMNRAHSAEQASASLELSRRYFNNITADLIYGIPGLSDEDWRKNVDLLIASGVQHISCYALTVETNTALEKMIREKKMADTDQDQQARQFLLLIDWLTAAGYEHYEISNFAKPGYRSRHNSAYWSIRPDGSGNRYLGIGPSAHSFNGSHRQWNISNNQQYIRSINAGAVPYTREELSGIQRKNEYIMTALRTDQGIDLGHFDAGEKNRLSAASRSFVEKGFLIAGPDSIRLTTRGKLFADGIAADLFE
jgi:oxygen-independent coproporphyrinogen-3 oxidase